ncbi:MAG: DUF2911 domain-containing protein [Chitinophagaceae bacterium]
MKIIVPWSFLLLFLLSCDNKTAKENTTVDTKQKDTVSISKSENNVNPYAQNDISPMDMSYFPVDYPKLKMTKPTLNPPLARVVYSRPHLQGRELFHDVLKYGEPWRLGANEATELDLYSDATIQGKKIKAGRYILYCIPRQDKWDLVLNSNIDSWGLQQDPSLDIARFTIPVTKTANSLEFFTMVFLQSAAGADLIMAWDNVEAKLPISF